MLIFYSQLIEELLTAHWRYSKKLVYVKICSQMKLKSVKT